MASGANSDAGSPTEAGIADPGLRLLARIGDFVAPLTRFGRGDIALEDSKHEIVRVAVRQTYRISFAVDHAAGVGPLPAGALETPDADATTRASAAQLSAARIAAAPRLADWAAAQGENPLAAPTAADMFQPVPPVGHVEICPACQGDGRIPCAACAAVGTVPCPPCNALGSSPCRTCETTGKLRCTRCYGLGHQLRDRSDGGQDRIPCTACAGAGETPCTSCHGRGRIICTTCHGQKTIACTQCQGAGSNTCAACEGAGRRHTLARLTCAIAPTTTITPRPSEPAINAVLKTLVVVDQVLTMAQDVRSSAEANADTLTRDTAASIPVATVTLLIAGSHTQLRAFGPDQTVRDYANAAGLLLADDLAALGAALPPAKFHFPPRTSPELEQALTHVLASPANATIALEASPDISALEQTFRGAVTGDYIRNAAASLKRAIAHAYWSELAHWPAAVLAIPLLQIPISLIVRGQPEISRIMAMIGIILLAIGGAILIHLWCARKLQHRLAPAGAPKLTDLLNRHNLTRNWLILASASAVVTTLLIATLMAALISPVA